jgi:hypothetical protein
MTRCRGSNGGLTTDVVLKLHSRLSSPLVAQLGMAINSLMCACPNF